MRPVSGVTAARLNCECACAGKPQQQHPATNVYVHAHVVDWARAPYIGGAYSYPSLGARPGDR
jgi:hypothetical protein